MKPMEYRAVTLRRVVQKLGNPFAQSRLRYGALEASNFDIQMSKKAIINVKNDMHKERF